VWSRIRFLIVKEFKQLSRDKKMRGIVFVAPILQILILGYAADMDVYRVPLAVYDQDRGVRARELVAEFVKSDYFRQVEQAASPADLDAAFASGRAEINLTIPRGFTADLEAGRTASIQLAADGSNSSSASIALSYASSIVADYSSRVGAVHASGGAPVLSAAVRVWYNPDLRTRLFMIPGVLALLLMMFTLILTSLAVVKEKELGTMEQLIVTPLRSAELIIGKLAPFVIVSFVIVLLVVNAAGLIFGIWPRGSVALLVALCGVFILSTLGLGLFVSSIAANQQQAMFFSIFFFMFPMTILSGFVFPIENMPPFVQAITLVLPLRYFFVIIRGIYLKGSDLSVLWPQVLPLLGIGLAVIVFSILRFKKRLD